MKAWVALVILVHSPPQDTCGWMLEEEVSVAHGSGDSRAGANIRVALMRPHGSWHCSGSRTWKRGDHTGDRKPEIGWQWVSLFYYGLLMTLARLPRQLPCPFRGDTFGDLVLSQRAPTLTGPPSNTVTPRTEPLIQGPWGHTPCPNHANREETSRTITGTLGEHHMGQDQLLGPRLSFLQDSIARPITSEEQEALSSEC